jgi:Zn finger protein HypA/HybF involved in hydrogenase expression
MGQAKLRGSREQRIAEAKARIEAIKPEYLICNSCEGRIDTVELMDTRELQGIDVAFAGVCPTCKKPTFAIQGEPWAVAQLNEVMSESMGEPIVGNQVLPLKNGGSSDEGTH